MNYTTINDKIRGSLMAGAAGDALGYEVEFMSRIAILKRYGEKGITMFEIEKESGKALVSDDTQMTLYTANGILNADCQDTKPIYAIVRAYLDWLSTQNRKYLGPQKSCWLSEIKSLYSLRAPGNTCLSALEAIKRGSKPINNSKGCGGIMRVAPVSLYAAVNNRMSLSEVIRLAGDAAESTHLHPLGFLSAAIFAGFIYKVVALTPSEVLNNIDDIIADVIDALDKVYQGEYEKDKCYLRDLTLKALTLANSNATDVEAIDNLGEGWVGEEAWAVALYCTIRHIDSVEDAIIASVNHNGDSDSTGAITGNIIGAIYGYEHIKNRNIFCPDGKDLETTLELSEVILTLADDLSQESITSTPDKNNPNEIARYERYYNITPLGLKEKLI